MHDTLIAARKALPAAAVLSLVLLARAGSLTAGTDAVPTFPNRVRVTNSAAQPIATATSTVLTWNAETYDDGELHSMLASPERLTAVKPGTYQISCASEWPNLSGAVTVSTLLRVNGATVIARQQTPSINGGTTIVAIATGYKLAGADYVECLAFHQAGRSVSVQTANSFFEMSQSSN